MSTRRSFIDGLGRFGLAGAAVPLMPGCATTAATSAAAPPQPSEHFDLVVIGSGFGGTISALSIAYKLDELAASRRPARPPRILVIERGTWWTTSTETVQDKQVRTRDFLLSKEQPTQEWSSLGDARGMFDLIGRCRYTAQRPQGLFDFVPIGKHGLFNLRNDGVSVLRASGVGGGSLIYSKILLRPPETLFDDGRWPAAWRGSAAAGRRNDLYRNALTAVTVGVEALFRNKATLPPTRLTGPSQILMRVPGITPASIRIAPPTLMRADPDRVIWQIDIAPGTRQLSGRQGELIDRARVFQTALRGLTPNYGSVDLSINDMHFAPPQRLSRGEQRADDEQRERRKEGTNVCERHGRCNIGCLPGAGQTLNKQLMRAIWGIVRTDDLDAGPPEAGARVLDNVGVELRALTQVDLLSEREGGGYLVHCARRRNEDPAGTPEAYTLSADRVIVAAGSLGSAELMLRCRQRAADSGGAAGLRGLSAALGDGFSPNGDHIAFLPETRERINLTYGPVTTSYGQFGAERPRADGFHQVEDQGVPRALAALTGHGMPVIQRLASGEGIERYLGALGDALKAWQQMFAERPGRSYPARHGAADLSTDRPEAEDELTAYTMCIVAQGKDRANGRFRLENDRLRLDMPDGKRYHEDPIYEEIRATLDKLAAQMRRPGSQATFLAPMSDVKIPLADRTVLTSHPLGGCRMADSIAGGVVDESGRVFRTAEAGGGFHRGLYIADGSVLPTALGVNPALTISAVALRVADRVMAEWSQVPARSAAA